MRKESRNKWEIWISNKRELEREFRQYLKKGIIRKITPNKRLAKSHFNKSFHNLDFANFTLKNQNKINKRIGNETYFDWVVVISYYAMYHSALALLYKSGYKTNNHLATICVLCKKYLGNGLEKEDIERLTKTLELNKEEIKEIGRAKERREKASYSGSISFEKHLAEITLKDARKFINKIGDIIGE